MGMLALMCLSPCDQSAKEKGASELQRQSPSSTGFTWDTWAASKKHKALLETGARRISKS